MLNIKYLIFSVDNIKTCDSILPTYQAYTESKVLEIGSGVDMDELATILDMGEF